jgi:hypothetical protein
LAPVPVFEPDDVVLMCRRHLQDRRVLQRRDSMDRARLEAEARPRGDHLLVQKRVAGRAELELRAAALDEPRLVLHPMELEAQRLARLDEEHFPDVFVGLGPDELVAPRLLDLARLERPGVEALEIGRVDAHPPTLRLGRYRFRASVGRNSGCAA